jgi:type IV pilus assembly protein PilM
MGIFTKNRTSNIGLDVSSTAVKLLEFGKELVDNEPRYRILNYAVVPLPTNAIVEKSVADVEAVMEAIESALEKTKVRTKHAVVAVAGSSVINKVISLPASLARTELDAQIHIAVEQHIPYPLNEVRFDYDILGPSDHSEELMDVLIVASRKETVDSLMQAVEGAGLECEVVDIEAYAVERAAQLLDFSSFGVNPSVIAMADIGATTMTLDVLQDGRAIYTREQNFGGSMLTEQIQSRYGMSKEEAGAAKKLGGLPEDYEMELLSPFKDSLVQQINRAVQFFYTAKQVKEIDVLVLSGGCAMMEGIEDLVSERLGIPTKVARPFETMAIGKNVDINALLKDSPAMMVAAGLAMRDL